MGGKSFPNETQRGHRNRWGVQTPSTTPSIRKASAHGFNRGTSLPPGTEASGRKSLQRCTWSGGRPAGGGGRPVNSAWASGEDGWMAQHSSAKAATKHATLGDIWARHDEPSTLGPMSLEGSRRDLQLGRSKGSPHAGGASLALAAFAFAPDAST